MKKAHAKAQRRGDKASEGSDLHDFAASRADSHAKDWPTAQLQDVCSFVSGGTPSKQKPEFWIGSIPWVSPKDMKKPRLRDVVDHISDAALDDGSSLVPAGSIFIVIRGMILAKDVPVALAEVPMAFNQDMKAIIPGSRVIPSFLLYALVAFKRALFQKIGRSAHGTMTLMTHDIAQFTIPVPPLSEQRRIAGVLGLVQRAVEQQERLLALVAELKQTLLHHLFTHGLRGEPQKPTDLGPIPQSWELRSCDELCEMISVGVVVKPASHYVPTGVPAFRSFNVREDRLNPSDLVYFSEETNNTKLAKSKLRKGDVLVVRTGYPGTSCVVPDEYDGANCIDLVIVRPKGTLVRSGFLSRFFNTPAGKRQAVAAKHGLAQQHLNVSAVKRTQIPVPSLEEQTEIDAAMATVQRKLALIEARKNALTSLFRTLLHQLMTAQLRVADLDVESLLAQAVPATNTCQR